MIYENLFLQINFFLKFEPFENWKFSFASEKNSMSFILGSAAACQVSYLLAMAGKSVCCICTWILYTSLITFYQNIQSYLWENVPWFVLLMILGICILIVLVISCIIFRSSQKHFFMIPAHYGDCPSVLLVDCLTVEKNPYFQNCIKFLKFRATLIFGPPRLGSSSSLHLHSLFLHLTLHLTSHSTGKQHSCWNMVTGLALIVCNSHLIFLN